MGYASLCSHHTLPADASVASSERSIPSPSDDNGPGSDDEGLLEEAPAAVAVTSVHDPAPADSHRSPDNDNNDDDTDWANGFDGFGDIAATAAFDASSQPVPAATTAPAPAAPASDWGADFDPSFDNDPVFSASSGTTTSAVPAFAAPSAPAAATATTAAPSDWNVDFDDAFPATV